MSARYYIVRGTLRSGPFSEQEMLDLLQTGRIAGTEFCQREGAPAPERIADLFDLVTAPQPMRGAGVPRRAEPAGPPDPFESDEGWEEAGAPEDDDWLDGDPDGGRDEEARSVAPIWLVRTHPSFLRYGAVLLGAVVLLAAGYLLAAYHDAFAFGSVGISSLIVVVVIYLRSSREYLVSRRRVEVVHGLIARSSREVRIEDIRAINVRKRGILGLLGVGTVEFSSSGTDRVEVAFDDVRGPHRIRRIVRALQDKGS